MRRRGKIIVSSTSTSQHEQPSKDVQALLDRMVAVSQWNVDKDPSVKQLKEKFFAVKVGG
jgi:hypothetical protein